MARPLQLFHRVADPASARVRYYVEDYALEDRVLLCNLSSPSVEAEFRGLGGHSAPALWDGTHLHQGAEAVLARLQAIVNLGREEG